MIKINLDAKTKVEIERMFWADLTDAQTGILQNLKKEKNKIILKDRHRKLYAVLYDEFTGELIVDEVNKLITANKETLQEYIKEIGKYTSKEKSDELLNNIFRYDCLSQRKVVRDVLKKIKVTVCPYCNRQYIFTLSKGKARPQLDHYYPKSKYPYLALSLYNLIPSCSTCNMAKSSLDTMETPILYPYEEEMGDDIKFEIRKKKDCNFVRVLQGISDEFVIGLRNENLENKKVITNQIEEVSLEE